MYTFYSTNMDEFGRSLTKGGLRLSSDMYPRKREDTLTVEGKEHKIITDSRGNEVYMYQPNPEDIRRQPSSRVSSSERDFSRPRTVSVYDYIDTESRVRRTSNNNFKIHCKKIR
ncbi:hypothetical protein MAR_034612, partial [Mya arenaria]